MRKKYKKQTPKFLWLLTTMDEYELPIFVTDTAEELAKLVGVKSADSVISAMTKSRQRGYRCKYKKVPFDPDD